VADEGEETCRVRYERNKYGTDSKWVRKKMKDDFRHPCIHSIGRDGEITTLWYSNYYNAPDFEQPKVVVSWNNGHAYNDFKGEFGYTQVTFAICVDSADEAEGIVKAFKSPAFQDILKSTMWLKLDYQIEWRMFRAFRKGFWKDFV